MEDPKRFDVIAVNIKTKAERFMARDLREKDADAVVMLAVMRRGVDEEYFVTRPAVPKEL